MSDDKFIRVTANVSNYHRQKLLETAFKYNMPIGRLIAIAIDHELHKDYPFQLNCELPTDESIEYAYAEQASLILSYMTDVSGLGLDSLVLLRHDIGIPSVDEFLHAFRECLEKEFIESYRPKPGPYQTMKYSDDYLHYRLKSKNPVIEKKQRLKNNRFKKLQRLKKEFKDE